MKSPLDLITMQDLFSNLKPATVFEFGSYSGGSALWFADMLKCFSVKSNVYSVDISFDCLHETAKKREDITFIKADVTKEMDKIFPEKMLKVFSFIRIPFLQFCKVVDKFCIPYR